jgi:hypothetical protein
LAASFVKGLCRIRFIIVYKLKGQLGGLSMTRMELVQFGALDQAIVEGFEPA